MLNRVLCAPRYDNDTCGTSPSRCGARPSWTSCDISRRETLHPRVAEVDAKEVLIPVPNPSVQRAIAEQYDRRLASARKVEQCAIKDWDAALEEFDRQLLADADETA